MKKTSGFGLIIILAVIVVVVIIAKPFYILEEGEQSVILRFGKVIGSSTEAGLKFKMPVVDTVLKFSNKILSWDGNATEIATKEQQFIRVDTTARWRIDDVELFYGQLQTLTDAYDTLDKFIDSSVKTVIAQNYLYETVRSSNHIIDYMVEAAEEKERQEILDAENNTDNYTGLDNETVYQTIIKGRDDIADEILLLANQNTSKYGIKLIDVVIRQIRYAEQSEPAVFQRMIKDRRKEAEGLRSYGRGQKDEWLGRLTKRQQEIISDANKTAAEIKAAADAEAAAIYSEAFERSPEFFAYWRYLESYKSTLPEFKKTLSTDLDYFDYLHNID